MGFFYSSSVVARERSKRNDRSMISEELVSTRTKRYANLPRRIVYVIRYDVFPRFQKLNEGEKITEGFTFGVNYVFCFFSPTRQLVSAT